MDMKRLFIALPIETGLCKQILKQFQSLDLPWEKLKVVVPEQMHLNLKFLGETPLEKLPTIIEALENLDLKIGDIELNICQSQIFNPKRSQVLNLSIKENPDLQKLYDTIDQKLFEESIANKEIRKFTPHITLARVKQAADIEEFKAFSDLQINKNFTASYFELVESELTGRGPIHSVLQTFDL